MKNLIRIIILLLFVCSCSSPSPKNHNYEEADSTFCPPEYVESSSSEQVAQIDSQKKTSRGDLEEYSLDTSKKRPFEMTQLDTTSLLPEIRRNKEIINQQQLALDSLLKKK